MKTFKLYAISLLEKLDGKVQLKKIPIQDGLIINMEDQKQSWFIEAVFDEEHYNYFKEAYDEKRHVVVDVIITSKDNHPAAMITSIQQITNLKEGISVLFDAKLALKKDDIIRDVLKDLVVQGYTSEQLISEFQYKIEGLSTHSQHTLDELYRLLQAKGGYNLQ